MEFALSVLHRRELKTGEKKIYMFMTAYHVSTGPAQLLHLLEVVSLRVRGKKRVSLLIFHDTNSSRRASRSALATSCTVRW
eukprot:7637344-Pyramimonas_sp.AAC.2